jgi:hypothetical protein
MYEKIEIQNKQTLCIDLADTYVTVVYAGTVDTTKRFIMSIISVTEGGADLTSKLHTLEEIKERLEDLTIGRPHPVVTEYLKFK